MPYQQGIMYIDRCEYCGTVDYELEYEVTDYDIGAYQFNTFLNEHAIPKLATRRKSDRAFSCSIENKNDLLRVIFFMMKVLRFAFLQNSVLMRFDNHMVLN